MRRLRAGALSATVMLGVFAILAGFLPTRAGAASVAAHVPAVPGAVVATPGVLSAAVSWTPPSGAVTGYAIRVAPGGRVISVPVAVSTWTVDGLPPDQDWSFEVAAVNADGVGAYSVATAPVTPTTAGGSFRALPPKRILDTRSGLGAPQAKLGDHHSMNLAVLGQGGVPASGVVAVVMNLTGVNATSGTYLTVWPTGEVKPGSSNVNVADGAATPNLVEVKVANGGVSIYNNSGTVDVIADVSGYVVATAASSGAEGRFHPLAPTRVLDTRDGTGGLPHAPVGPGETIDVAIAGHGGVPASGADAVVVNLTATEASASTYVTAWPSGTPAPVVSNLNLVPGETRPNRVTVKLGIDGKISLRNNGGTVHLILDVGGWLSDAASPPAIGAWFQPLSPVRIVDTRVTPGALTSGSTMKVQVAGHGGVPANGQLTPATAVVANVTAVASTAASFLTIWPSGSPQPVASDLNFSAGETIPNLVVVKLGSDGAITIITHTGAVHVVVDVLGYYAGDVELASNVTRPDPASVTAVGDTSLTFSAPPAGVGVGDVIALGTGPMTPGGLLRRALVVSGSTVTTGPAALDDVLVDGAITLDNLADGGLVSDAELAPPRRRSSPSDVGGSVSVTLDHDIDGVVQIAGSFTITADASLHVEAHRTWSFPFVDVDAEANASLDENFHGSITGAVTSGERSRSWPLGSYHGAPVPLDLFGVPVVARATISGSINASASAEGTFYADVSQSQHIGIGIAYHGGAVTPTTEASHTPFTFTGPTATFNADREAGGRAVGGRRVRWGGHRRGRDRAVPPTRRRPVLCPAVRRSRRPPRVQAVSSRS